MASAQFSLSWEAHKKNICHGLSSLQQNGEFVDMTLAADGHMVKVHQVIIALASPFIKELIASAQCQHPVIFLNKVSYATLSSLLEYIYTGEVLVSYENLDNLVEAGKELHIKGLEDMNIHGIAQNHQELPTQMEEEMLDEEYCYFEVADNETGKNTQIYHSEEFQTSRSETDKMVEVRYDENLTGRNSPLIQVLVKNDDSEPDFTILPDRCQEQDVDKVTAQLVKPPRIIRNIDENSTNLTTMQYTVSNQGSLQMILNRFIYYLKHTNRDGSRQWRCVDYLNAHKCPAHVNTKDDVVQQRIASHNHAFHDKRILKKIKANAIFSAIKDAEAEGVIHKNTKLLDILQESE